MSIRYSFVVLLLSLLSFSYLFPNIYTVTNVGDAGPGTLREAITLANTNIGYDTIEFNIAAPGVKTITLNNNLPNVIDPVFINGASDPFFAGTPLIELNVNGFLQGLNVTVTAPGSHITGLIINRALTNAILVQGNNVKITGCYLGTNSTGAIAYPNNYAGIEAQNVKYLQVGGIGLNEPNLISGNNSYGIRLLFSDSTTIIGNKIGTNPTGTFAIGNGAGVFDGSGISTLICTAITIGGSTPAHRNLISGNLAGINHVGEFSNVYGNYIGTDVTGMNALPNQTHGIIVVGENNEIGGVGLGQGNLISGNTGSGIHITSNFSLDNQVIGNLIGTDPLGTTALPNGNHGVEISAGAIRNTIGGLGGADRNLISGNTNAGIDINAADSNYVYNNFIGVDINGTALLGNGTNGITITSAFHNFVGNASVAGANLIGGNGADGILISGAGANNTQVKQNYIGTNNAGAANLANAGRGIFLTTGASFSEIGGLVPNEGNIIANNLQGGVEVNGATTLQNTIWGNSIFDHPVEGIRLTGGNINQEPPVITGFAGVGPTTIFGTFNSAPNTTYRIEFFTSATASQGKTYIGFAMITTDAAGIYNLNEVVPATVNAVEPVLSATATDPNGNTSPFAIEAVLNTELLSFQAEEISNHRANLTWELTENQQELHFVIEHEQANGDFEKIGEQHVYQSHSSFRAYDFQTDRLLPGAHKFRLLMIGKNGERNYSKSVVLNIVGQSPLEIYLANPIQVSGKLGILVQEEQHAQISLLDMRGKEIQELYSGTLQANKLEEIELQAFEQLSEGVYLLRIKGTYVETIRKVIKR